jgi:hypothetical protein
MDLVKRAFQFSSPSVFLGMDVGIYFLYRRSRVPQSFIVNILRQNMTLGGIINIVTFWVFDVTNNS